MAFTHASAIVRERGLAAMRSPEVISPSEWAEKYVEVTDGERQGPIRFSRGYEFQREILDTWFGDYDPGEVRRVGCGYKGAQSGITLLCLIGILYWVVHKGVSAFHLLPRSFDADDKAKKLAEIIECNPDLKARFVNSILRVRKTGKGQTLRVAFSNSPAELKNWQAGIGVYDEVDELEVKAYDSMAMARQRMGAYRRRIEVYIGTPTLPSFGVHRYWETSDQREWQALCPVCEEFQVLTWENISWDTTLETDDQKAESATFVCIHCDQSWDHKLRERANAKGKWVITRPEYSVIGFGMNRIMVPSSIPAKMVSDFLLGLTNEQSMREHVNQNLGECYLPTSGKLNSHTVEMAIDHEIHWGKVPRGAVIVTAGIDTQGACEPYDFVWEVRAFDHTGYAFLFAYGIAKEQGILDLFGQVGLNGKYTISRGLVDISDGHHKEAVTRLCTLCPSLQPARFDWHRKATFDRGKVVKVKKGHDGYSVNVDDALQDNLGRFFESEVRGRRISVAPNPSRALETEWVNHYTHIARIPEQTPNGIIYSYSKLRTTGVDFPYSGGLAEYCYRFGGNTMPGKGNYGSINKIKRQQAKTVGPSNARVALRIIKRR